MVLATQCPFCQTTFRVAQDQLTLRGGLVRCGSCKEVFDGNAHLLLPDSEEPLLATSSPKPSVEPPLATPLDITAAPDKTPPAWLNLADTFASVAAATNDAPWGVAADDLTLSTADATTPVSALNKQADATAANNPPNDIARRPERDIAAELRQETSTDVASEAQTPDLGEPDQLNDSDEDEQALPAFVQHAERRARLQKIFRIVM
eukprot:gene33552-43084_t